MISSIPSPVRSPKNTLSTCVAAEVNRAIEFQTPSVFFLKNSSRVPPASPFAQKLTTSEVPHPSKSREMIAER